MDRGAQVRIVTGDYLEITQVEALERLLDLQSGIAPDPSDPSTGRLEARVIESSHLPHPTRSFHPKSWWFECGPPLKSFSAEQRPSPNQLEYDLAI